MSRTAIKAIDAVAAAAVLVIVAGWLLKTPVSAKGWERRDLNDYTLNLRHSHDVDATHVYPFGFTYPPPSVLLRLGFGVLGFELGGGLWIALSGVSLLASLIVALRMLDGFAKPGWGIAALVALVLVKYPFEFEYKYLNANAMYLALVLTGIALLDSRSTLGGFFLSLSIALKLYSVVFVPWLLLTRRNRAALATAAYCCLWFVALPILFWGLAGAWEVYTSWFQRVRETGARDFPVLFAPNAYLVSLHATVLMILERTSTRDPLETALIATRGLHAVWLIAVVAAFAVLRRPRNARTAAADVSLLLILPLPLSGQLQPHHLVVLLPASILLSNIAPDRSQSRRLQALCVVVLAGAFVVMEFVPGRAWRGAAMNFSILLYFIGLLEVKRSAS